MALDYLNTAGLTRFWNDIKGQIGHATGEQVDAWLDNHPEATTTVQDNSINGATKLIDGSVPDSKLAQSGGILEEVSDLEGIVTYSQVSTANAVTGKYVTASTGALATNSSYDYVEFNVIPNDKLIYKEGIDETVIGLAFYNKSGAYISGNLATSTESEITVPANAYTCKASIRNNHYEWFKLTICSRINTLVDYTVQNINNLQDITNAGFIDRKIDSTGKIDGYFVDASTGGISANAIYSYVQFNVVPTDSIKYTTSTNESIAGIAFYDNSGVYINGALAIAGTLTISVPSNAVVAKASMRKNYASVFSVVVMSNIQKLVDYSVALGNQGAPSFVIPSKSVAVVGHEYNIFFDSIIKYFNKDQHMIKVVASPAFTTAKLFERCFRTTPVSGDIGNHTVTISVYDKSSFKLLSTGTMTVSVIADVTITNKKVLVIGDSLTDAAVFPGEIQFGLTSEGMESIGTRSRTVGIPEIGSKTVYHEGRSGWATYDYTRTVQNYKTDVPNPFWDGTKFNFSYYMTNSGVSTPDIIIIGLGTNGYTDGLEALGIMIESIRTWSATIPIIIGLLHPNSYQDGYAYLNSVQFFANIKKKVFETNAAYIASYENGSDSNIHIADICTLFDRDYDYATEDVVVSARNPATMTVQKNNIHPSSYGYLHFADAYYNRIVDILS